MMHKIKGTIIHGNQLGRRLGFPTANIAIAEDLPVQDGVYIAEVNVDGNVWRSMVNVGTRPTVEGRGGRFAEAHLLDFSDDIYDREAIIFLLGYVRPEVKFNSLDELKIQLEKDKATVAGYFTAPNESDKERFNMHLHMKSHPHSGHPHSPHSAHPSDSQHTQHPHSIKKP